jgi:uncharacterized protein YcgL (UPF0745 family)
MRNIIFAIILIPYFLFSQEISFSEDYSIRNDLAYYLIENVGGSFVLFRDIPKDHKIHLMDEKMMDKGEVSIDFQYKNPRIYDVVKARDDEFSVIYSAKKKGSRYLFIENFDRFGVTQDSLTIISENNLYHTFNYQIEKSKDETKVLVYSINLDRTVDAIMVDVENLKILWTNTFDQLDVKQNFQIKDLVVSNLGDLYIVLLKDNSNPNRDKTRFEFHTLRSNSNKLDFVEISTEGKLSSSSKFVFDELNNSLVGAGLYSEKNSIRSQGFFYINIPLDQPNSFNLSFNKFDEEFLQEYLKKRVVGNNAGIASTEIRDIVLRRDGGIVMMGEKIESKIRGGANIPVGFHFQDAIKADYYYDQIFISSIHPDGKVHWTKIIQKKQYSYDDAGIYSSFFQFVSNDGIHLLFNDEVRNQSTISDFTIKGNGEYKRSAIINTIGTNIKLRVRDALQTSAKEIVIPSQYRNKLRMVKFEF